MTSNADSRGAQFRAPGSSAKRSALEERWARRMSAGPGDDAPFPAMEIMRAIKITTSELAASRTRTGGRRTPPGQDKETRPASPVQGSGGWREAGLSKGRTRSVALGDGRSASGRDDRHRAAESSAQSRSQRPGSPRADRERNRRLGRQKSSTGGGNHSRSQDRRTAEIGREAGLSRGSTSHARENKQTIRKGKSSASDGIIHAIKLARRWSVASSGRAPRRRRPASHRRTTAQPPQRLENRAKLRTRIRPLKRSRLQPRQAPRAGPSPAGRRRHRPAKRAPSPARRRPR